MRVSRLTAGLPRVVNILTTLDIACLPGQINVLAALDIYISHQ